MSSTSTLPVEGLRRALALAVALLAPLVPAAAVACTVVPGYDYGRSMAPLCEESLAAPWVLLDLADDWAPRILSETPEQPQPYRAVFVALANERFGPGREWAGAQRDAHFELFGIFPSFSVLRARLADAERHACHAGIDDSALREWRAAPGASAARRAARRAAIATAQAHLTCERLLSSTARTGVLEGETLQALGLYQRRHMLPSLPELDAETADALLTSSRELDFRALLRALRERVVDATGLLEDGSARNGWEPVVGRQIEPAEYRRVLRNQPLPSAAPDLIARATEAATLHLGWTSPEDAAGGLQWLPRRAAVLLPPVPAYHSSQMSLRVEIAPDDAAQATSGAARALCSAPLPPQRPTLTLFADTPQGAIPLVRWPTTVGGWKRQKLAGGQETLRYKPSPAGRYQWRELWVAPAWFPPLATPDRELLRPLPGGGWALDREALGPGYRSAYGLLALSHHRSVWSASGGERLVDSKIRTHGSGNFRSVLRGTSHGCHRLFNHLAIRLGGFLLAHVENERQGLVAERYSRVLHWGGQRFPLRMSSRGYRYELLEPVPVDVLPAAAAHVRAPAGAAPAAMFAPDELPLDGVEAGPEC